MSRHGAFPCVLVSGGTRGIGRAVVDRLVDAGYHVGFTYRRDPVEAGDVCEQLRLRCGPGQRVQAFQMNLADRHSLAVLPQQVLEAFGRLDALVNNAGLTDDGAFLSMDPRRWERVLSINFSGTAALSLAAIPHLLRGQNPAIVTVASLAGCVGKEGQVAYATSKGALIGLTQWLGRRYGASGLRVNAVAPGFIHTDMVDGLEPTMFEHILQGSALKRMGEPSEVAEAVAFLLQPGYLQATTLRVDGGFKR